MKVLASLTLAALGLAAHATPAGAADKAGAEPRIVHDVYFTLKDNSPAARHQLVAACKKYLTNHPGEVFFEAGTRAEEFNREVNDRDWDVSLHVVFKNKAAHDQYQEAERHKQFIQENKDNWKKVRVFDSVAESVQEK